MREWESEMRKGEKPREVCYSGDAPWPPGAFFYWETLECDFIWKYSLCSSNQVITKIYWVNPMTTVLM